MQTRAIGSILRGAGAAALLWLGLDWLEAGAATTRLPMLGGLAAVAAGEWLCWQALAAYVRPPRLAGRVVGLTCGALLAGLALTAAVVVICEATS